MAQAAENLRLLLLTEGDPSQLTGGHLYQQRILAAAHDHEAHLQVRSLPRQPIARQMAAARRLLRWLPALDVLLIDSIVAAAAAPWLPSVARRVPILALVHQQPGGVDHGWAGTAVRAGLDLVAYRRADAVIAVSEWLAERLRQGRIAGDRLFVVPPGREPAASTVSIPREDLRRGRNAAVLCVSNWTRNKRVHLALDALAGLQQPLATLHLVGGEANDPVYAAAIRSRLARDDLTDRVVVHGTLPPEDVANLMRSADVLVHPSRHESYGAAVAEAMGAGLPVVAFAIDNLPFLIRDGIDGFLVRDHDVPALAAAMALLCSDESRRRTMGTAAQARAMGWPTWLQTADRVYEIAREVARSGARARS